MILFKQQANYFLAKIEPRQCTTCLLFEQNKIISAPNSVFH
jgi:hypothetical protein